MPNHPEVHDDYIEIILEGAQTTETVRDLIKKNDAAIGKFVVGGKPLKLLVNLSAIGNVATGAYSAGIETMQDHTFAFEQLAIFGIKRSLIQEMVNLMVRLFSGKHDIKVFNSRDEALNWLGVKD